MKKDLGLTEGDKATVKHFTKPLIFIKKMKDGRYAFRHWHFKSVFLINKKDITMPE